MAGISTALATSFKKELLNGQHCMAAQLVTTGNAGSGSTSVTSLASVAGLCLGMTCSGTNIQSGSIVTATGTTTCSLSKTTSGAISGGTLTFTGDTYMIALVKASGSLSGTYGASTALYSSIGSDEVPNGSGYTTGGVQLTPAGAVTSGTTALMDFADVSWTSATFSMSGAVIYNNTARAEGVTGRVVSTHSIGDTTVTSGTLSLIFPTPDASNAIIRLN